MAYDKSYPLFLVATAYSSSPPHQLFFFCMWNTSKSLQLLKKNTTNNVKNRAIQIHDNLIFRKAVTLIIQLVKSITTSLEFD